MKMRQNPQRSQHCKESLGNEACLRSTHSVLSPFSDYKEKLTALKVVLKGANA